MILIQDIGVLVRIAPVLGSYNMYLKFSHPDLYNQNILMSYFKWPPLKSGQRGILRLHIVSKS